MPFRYIFLAGFFLGIISVFAITLGENVLYYLGQFNTLSVQVPIALLIAIVIFIIYIYILHKIGSFDIEQYSVNDGLLIYAVALALSPFLFFLLHYFTQDIVVSWKGIFSVLFWQIPANLIILFILHEIVLKWKQ